MFSAKRGFKFITLTKHNHDTRHARNVGVQTPILHKAVNPNSSYYLAHIILQKIPKELLECSHNLSISKFKQKVTNWITYLGREEVESLLTSVYVAETVEPMVT